MHGSEEYQSNIEDNINNIKEKVAAAAQRAGRNPDEIRIIAVTKNVEPLRILEAINAGILDLGENRVQELVDKITVINRDINWHMIGHLQKNKVKYIIDKIKMIHSLDNIELAREINVRAEKVQRVIDVLIQVNVAEEETKYGIYRHQLMDFIKEISNYRNIRVKGLMTIAPKVQDPNDVRPVFQELRKIFIDISRKNIDNIDMDFLSMGMSNDFEVAIEEGANIIRIGTSIFGKRTA
ncbi:MAG TPA: YggS family pyridoxal phosphate-dependent enzyme [Clostridiales bacterium]|nr:YggS family pyridoxal phosphate-dependent enzyme [Clostridiales bacterium]